MRRLPSLSVFFPCHNEAANIGPLVEHSLRVLEQYAERIEIIVVDDGSTDGTPELMRSMGDADPRVRTVRHEKCGGYGAALKSGFAAARHEYVFLTDGDAQFEVADFSLLMDALANADIAIGYRIDRKDNWVRRLNGLVWNRLVRWMFGLRARDIDCAFKLLPTRVVQSMGLRASGAVISTELLVGASRAGLRIQEVGVQHRPRVAGTPTGGKITVILRAFRELFQLWWRLRSESRA